MTENLNNLKRHIFFELLNLAGRAFVLVRHSDNVVLGNRGFTAEEKEDGIVLVFNARMNLLWDEYGITATLVFGTSTQKCFIPADDIIAVYSPELNAQFAISPKQTEADSQQEDWSKRRGTKPKEQTSPAARTSENVIKVDFTKKKK